MFGSRDGDGLTYSVFFFSGLHRSPPLIGLMLMSWLSVKSSKGTFVQHPFLSSLQRPTNAVTLFCVWALTGHVSCANLQLCFTGDVPGFVSLWENISFVVFGASCCCVLFKGVVANVLATFFSGSLLNAGVLSKEAFSSGFQLQRKISDGFICVGGV